MTMRENRSRPRAFGAEQEHARLAGNAEQVKVAGEHPPQLVLVATHEEPDRSPLLQVLDEPRTPRLGVEGLLDDVHVAERVESSLLVEEVDPGRRIVVGAAALDGVVGRHELREQRDNVEAAEQHGPHHRQLVADELLPHQAPLRGDVELLAPARGAHLAGRRPHAVSALALSRRMRGSTITSSTSERKVPTTVSRLSNSTVVPAKKVSWLNSAS